MHQRQSSATTTLGRTDATQARTTRSFGSNQDRIDALAQTQGSERIALKPPGGLGGLGDPPTIFVACFKTRPANATAANTVDQANLGAIDANTQYVELSDGPCWLDISTLSAGDRGQVVTWLQESGGQVSVGSNGTITVGAQQEEVRFGADTEDPRKVIADANERDQDAEIWDFLNGGETALDASETDRTGWADGQKKPGAWYNSYELEDGVVTSHTSDFDARGQAGPALDEEGLKKLIMRCLDIGGIKAAMGDDEDTFVAALTARFSEGHPLGPKGLESVAHELWSYLHTGAGTDGKVDIGRLQALVRAISPDTQATADSNTPFEGEAFEVGGTDQTLKRGDGKFGRATMLSLLHLFGTLERTLTEPNVIGTVPGGMIGDHDYFVHDRSGSMMGTPPGTGPWPKAKNAVDQSQGWTSANGVDSRTVGQFGDKNLEVGTTRLNDMADALERAYETLYAGDDSKVSRDKFAALFGLKRQDIFDQNGLMADELMRLLGDGAGTGFGGTGESSLKSMLFVLTHPEALPPGHPLRTRLELGSQDPNKDPIRLNSVADEKEQGLEYLELVRALSAELGVEVRIVAVPHGDVNYELDPVNHLMFLDLDDITLDPVNDQATVEYMEGGQSKQTTVPLDTKGRTQSAPYNGKMMGLPGIGQSGTTN